MQRIKTGLIAGLIAVTLTTVVNVVARLIGLLPEAMDMKNMAEFVVDPARSPAVAFTLGVVFHILSGGAVGIAYALLLRRWTPLSGMLFMFLGWLGMMLVLFPLTGRGAFGLNVGPVMPVATFSLSTLYGATIGAIAGKVGASPLVPVSTTNGL